VDVTGDILRYILGEPITHDETYWFNYPSILVVNKNDTFFFWMWKNMVNRRHFGYHTLRQSHIWNCQKWLRSKISGIWRVTPVSVSFSPIGWMKGWELFCEFRLAGWVWVWAFWASLFLCGQAIVWVYMYIKHQLNQPDMFKKSLTFDELNGRMSSKK
jgi:hypothetical protein